jgi:putative transcriptional regulator
MTSRKIDKIVNEKQRNVASNLIALREGASLTQLQLSELAGIDRKTINRIENGHFSPSVDTLVRLALVLNSTVGNLLDD